MTRVIDLCAGPGVSLDASVIGGKAASLGRLARVGFPVPAAAVIPADVADGDIAAAAAELADRFAGARLAVRSSGLSEDLADASFAGQFETILDVAAETDALTAAIRAVRASVHADHLAAYHHRVDDRMAVLVMRMVDADAAGVAFTRNPVTEADETIIEAVPGLGDRLAAGEADGERWVATTDAEIHLIGDSLGALSQETASRVADLARRVEAEMGSAQDIEWAAVSGEVVILQTRAITTAAIAPVPITDELPPGPWARDMTHQLQPSTPLIGSFFPGVFTDSFVAMSEELGMPIDRIEARVIRGYFHIQIVPFGVEPGGSLPPRRILRALWAVIPKLRARAKHAAAMLARERHFELAAEWEHTVRPAALRRIADWVELDRRSLSAEALAAHLGDVLAFAAEMFRWNVMTDPSYLLPLLDLVDFLADRDLGDVSTALDLLVGHSADEYRRRLDELGDVLRGDPDASRIVGERADDVLSRLDRAAPEFAARYRDHLRRYGLRVLGFDLDAPTLLEDPRLELDRMLAGGSSGDVVSPDSAAEIRVGLATEEQQVFDTVLTAARQRYAIREDGESLNSAGWGAVRLAALEIGRRMSERAHLETATDAVFLTHQELAAWLERPADQRKVVERRKGERAWAMANPAAEFVGDVGPPPDPRAFPASVARLFRAVNLVAEHDSRMPDLAEGADGVGASAGSHTGPVRLVDGAHEFAKVRAGDVLVCRTTASPWEVLFPTIGALVTEGGGLLSHPAIVAREHGLPAVLGVADAMSRFHDGQLVRVDGAAGTVQPVNV